MISTASNTLVAVPPDRRRKAALLAFFSASGFGQALIALALAVNPSSPTGAPVGASLPILGWGELLAWTFASLVAGRIYFAAAAIDPRHRLRGKLFSPWSYSAGLCALLAVLLSVYALGGAFRHSSHWWLPAGGLISLYIAFACMGLAIICLYGPQPGDNVAIGDSLPALFTASSPGALPPPAAYSEPVANTFLARSDDHQGVVLFRSSNKEKRQYLFLSIIGLVVFGLMDVGSLMLWPYSSNSRPLTYLFVFFFPIVSLLGGYVFVVALRQVYVNRIEFDLNRRAYRQTSVNQASWSSSVEAGSAMYWRAPKMHSGAIGNDLRGVGVRRVTVKRGVVYQVVAAWRDLHQPEALLSQPFRNVAEASAVMHDVAALLIVPALGELNL